MSKYRGMRNPLRRVYRQLSRLIVNEGFKDFASRCNLQQKHRKYQAAKDAYSKIQSNDELKKFYKLKMAKDGINISNLDQALYDASSKENDETDSVVEKFLEDYKNYSASYEQYFKDEREKRRLEKSSTEYLLVKQKKKDDGLKDAFADNVVEDTDDYIVYEVRTFDEANQMRWMWMGDVLKISNTQCKKLDPNAPGDSESYKGDKTPEQMAEYMMSNDKFIMNPSWCVCAGKSHWNSYKCGETNKDGSASCHLIFSKKYPNCRFCVVRNSSKFEIRDPWQAGGFNKEKRVQYGYEVMEAVFGDSAKQIACLHGVAEKILASKFISALQRFKIEDALQILEEGIDPNYKDELGDSLLIHAVRYRAVTVCKQLLDYGADFKIKDKYCGDAPLHMAASRGYTEICKLLLEYGDDVNVKDGDGWTPLHYAAGNTKTCQLLLDNGADVNAKNNDGKTPLHEAAAGGEIPTCKLLLDNGAVVNVKDENQWTPLHWAACAGSAELCKMLIEYGADVNPKDKNDKTPLYFAMDYGYIDVSELLRQYMTRG